MNTEKIEIKSMEACVVFDKCAVLIAELSNGEIITETCAAKTPEEFNQDKAVETCMKQMLNTIGDQITMSADDAAIIMALADCSLNISAAARQTFFGRAVVDKHIKKIEEKTGKNPTKFNDLCELLPIAKRVLRAEE